MSHDTTVTSPRPATFRCRRIRLEVVTGRDAGAHHDFLDTARIGTRGVADLVLKDPKVSGLHCEIVGGEQLRVRDLGSKNGTFLGGFRVADAIVPPGESITVGDSQVRVTPVNETVDIPLHPADDFHGFIGSSAGARALTARLARLAASDATVLILGETGTGKDRVAEALHLAGPRAERPFVVVDCGALPPTLIESELYGHERGAFTGAVAAAAGAFERAQGGTLFLDEIGEVPLELQPKLLRVLESRTLRRIGGDRNVHLDARVVAATNRDLALEVTRGRFREDLYYRVAVVTLTVPPLRQRLEDVPLLAVHFLNELGVDPASYLTADAVATLASYEWPGNVRELRNTLERAVALMKPVAVDPAAAPAAAGAAGLRVDVRVPLRVGKQQIIDEYERAYLTAMLVDCAGNVSEVARRAGMDRMSIHRLMQKLGLRGGRREDPS
jgi:transcriptional regulator with GAF, ATPase, and Fis domain